MYSKTVCITNSEGLHARPAGIVVKSAKGFSSKINMKKDDVKVNAKSIINVLSLGANKGSNILIEAEGEDEKEAVNALAGLIENGFSQV
ncbi:HPr family phosphocarrier protein [Lachnospiraceae bacterium ZAX-1]